MTALEDSAWRVAELKRTGLAPIDHEDKIVPLQKECETLWRETQKRAIVPVRQNESFEMGVSRLLADTDAMEIHPPEASQTSFARGLANWLPEDQWTTTSNWIYSLPAVIQNQHVDIDMNSYYTGISYENPNSGSENNEESDIVSLGEFPINAGQYFYSSDDREPRSRDTEVDMNAGGQSGDGYTASRNRDSVGHGDNNAENDSSAAALCNATFNNTGIGESVRAKRAGFPESNPPPGAVRKPEVSCHTEIGQISAGSKPSLSSDTLPSQNTLPAVTSQEHTLRKCRNTIRSVSRAKPKVFHPVHQSIRLGIARSMLEIAAASKRTVASKRKRDKAHNHSVGPVRRSRRIAMMEKKLAKKAEEDSSIANIEEDKEEEEDADEEESTDENPAVYGCICGVANDGPDFMIQCDSCDKWQHNVCMGLPLLKDAIADEYECEQCVPGAHPCTIIAAEEGRFVWEERQLEAYGKVVMTSRQIATQQWYTSFSSLPSYEES